MTSHSRLILAAVALLAFACGGSAQDGFTKSEWATIKTLSPLPAIPANPTNQYADNEAAARFGQVLFYEKGLSGPLAVGNDGTNGGLGQVGDIDKVACSDCHLPNYHYCDNRSHPDALSLGSHWGKRNSPSALNVAYYPWITWAGRLDSLWAQGAAGFESPDMAGDRCQVAHWLWTNQRDTYNAIFADKLPDALDPDAPDASRFPAFCNPKAAISDATEKAARAAAWNAMAPDDQTAVLRIMSNVGKAVEAYERKLVTGPAPFDRFVAGDKNAISASAKRGLKLFIGRAFCVECHSGPTFSDGAFHNLGVPQVGDLAPAVDDGRFTDLGIMLKSVYSEAGKFSDDPAFGQQKEAGLTASDADHGAFRTKDLRGVADSAPYFHDGAFGNLWDVIDFYDQGGGNPAAGAMKDPKMRPLNLTAEDKDDLIAFLQSLSGAEPPADWAAPQQ